MPLFPYSGFSRSLRRIATLALFLPSVAAANDPAFVRHQIDPKNDNSACAVIDVDQDGDLDIVCGGSWYEAPGWSRHFVRNVERIRGRNDDYSSLPLDVDGDGWTDVVSVNYRSQSLYWARHPGEAIKTNPDAEWKTTTIDRPGASETGRLADIDGDGQSDILPNGTKFAAWYERVAVAKTGDEEHRIGWKRHPLPDQAAGHGLGAGDVNGDGRTDIVGPRGWFEAPEDHRTGRWQFRDEFRLHRDASIPILVHDVDSDGDADIIWGRGHNIGLYWLEQTANETRRWTRHVIDTSFSSVHSLLLADIDNDGQSDLIAGKRYMGHDGKDPGEYDPLPIDWYAFDRTTKTWKRGIVSVPDDAGFDLDPKVADLDGDGDVDVIAPSRNGLNLFENLLFNKSDRAADQIAAETPEYDDHRTLRTVRSEDGTEQPIDSPWRMALRRHHILGGMSRAMGSVPDPSRRVSLDIKTLSEETVENYTRRKITFASEPNDRVPAWLLIPEDLTKLAAAMLCLHQTTKIGKDEPAGLGGRPTLHYAHELAQRGYVCIVPDYPSFGEYPYDFRTNGGHYPGGSMKAIWNNMRAVDVLESLEFVDHDRIGAIGHSLGGHNALFTAAFEQRVRAVVTSCGFTAFHHYYGGKLAGWTSDRYMPRIRDVYGNDPDRVPFDFHEVLGAIAPRPIFVNAPLHDSNFDNQGVRQVVAEVERAFDVLGSKNTVTAVYPDSAHDFPDEVRQQAYDWLDHVLK